MSLLLNSPYLRRIGAPIRRATPVLYERLNEVRKRLIRKNANVEAYQALALNRFATMASLSGARVLEVGSDLEMHVLKHLATLGVREVIGVNPLAPAEGREHGRARLIQGNVQELSFENESFDYVFSVATFEHIADVGRALAEMHRVLRPGGILFAEIGPIWSSGVGHHLDVRAGDEIARFSRAGTNPLPDFCHLLMGPAELEQALQGRVSPALVQPIVSWVYESTDINRLFYRDYIRAFEASPFHLASLTHARDPIDAQLSKLLRFRYPNEDSFDVTNMTAVFIKR